ncbi:4-(cytidine 5'-diphospho)-2-C-methyl-D-erythritol kinase [Asticcacaulis sp. 201]|uniref:4-(cytidine 5'-diphospho)-2-C-methyl-D-erythritol kinase n=1 Tax=Asticcacaulis sp. 201 TaxID=3028787 RepID=UPI00291705D6|nr:4-(cytidine 5'-diphospho)-2-C-methyl-D-erythritol kinase [Asticcacaulis sp. 201]MDV6329583.1 4-(cytidine 5'-diphospho)-2-C-methyl-D-erythritol kinase [Asticcacaulis sp. 201]
MRSGTARTLAPAKVNLYLHVAAPDSRGYHPLQSLVVFADFGDEVALLDANSTGSIDPFKAPLNIDGPFGAGLGAGEDNLVMKAVRRFEAACGIMIDRHIHLTKTLPIASGIGGGSADAGAVLQLLRKTYAPDMSDAALAAIAGGIGADGIMCLWSRSSFAEGYGEVLTPVDVPSVPAVLINPLVECSTARVYGGYDALGAFGEIDAMRSFGKLSTIDHLVTALSRTRNDLQRPAIQLQPVIADVLTVLEAQPQTLFARMSGSGATCFALCRTAAEAEALSVILRDVYPAAWVRSCRLG